MVRSFGMGYFVPAAIAALMFTVSANAQTLPVNISGSQLTSAAPSGANAAPLTAAASAGRMLFLADYAGLHRDGVNDDSQALAHAEADAMAQHRALYVGPGPLLIARPEILPALGNTALICEDVNNIYYQSNQGSVFLITGTKASPFRLTSDVTIRGCNFLYPNQTEAAAEANNGQPIVYPPLFANAGPGSSISSIHMSRLRVTNAYDLFAVDSVNPSNGARDGVGDVVISDMRAFALHDYFRFRNTPEVINVTNSLFSPESWQAILGGNGKALLNFYANNATLVHAVGQGTPTSSDGSFAWLFMENDYALGMLNGWLADGAAIQGTAINVGFDGVPNIVHVKPGGSLTNFEHRDSNVYASTGWFGSTVNPANIMPAAYYIDQPSPGGANLDVENIHDGWFGTGILATSAASSNIGGIRVAGQMEPFAASGTCYPAISIDTSQGNDPGMDVDVGDTRLWSNTSGCTGIAVNGNQMAVFIHGNRFSGLASAVNIGAVGGTPVVLEGNYDTFTSGHSVSGAVTRAAGQANFWWKWTNSAATE